MFPTIADLEQAERYLEADQPLHTVQRGVELDFRYALAPDQPALRVAYRTYTPDERVVPGLVVLFIPGEHQSGALYDEAASALAARGISAAALSLGWHGSGRWHSLDPWSADQLTIERYGQQVRLVISALPLESRLILVGGGILGSLLAQQVAGDLPLAGLALLGGCLPHLAAASGKAIHPLRRWWRRVPSPARPDLVPPPGQERIRSRWLGYFGVSDQEVFAVWQHLCAESPLVWTAYEARAGHPIPVPSLPALVMGGDGDTLVTPALLEQTARAYGVQPIIIRGAPHLLVRSPQRSLIIEHLAAFCLETASAGSPHRAAAQQPTNRRAQARPI